MISVVSLGVCCDLRPVLPICHTGYDSNTEKLTVIDFYSTAVFDPLWIRPPSVFSLHQTVAQSYTFSLLVGGNTVACNWQSLLLQSHILHSTSYLCSVICDKKVTTHSNSTSSHFLCIQHCFIGYLFLSFSTMGHFDAAHSWWQDCDPS